MAANLALIDEAPSARVLPYNTRIAAALRYVVEHGQDQPSLETMAEQAGLSPFHFQRVKRWAGISPKRFLQYVTLAQAKLALADGASVLDAALDAGLSGPSRLHDLLVACDAMTPGEFKALGDQFLVIRWGLHDAPLGRVLVGTTERGLCWLAFVERDDAPVIAEFESANGAAPAWCATIRAPRRSRPAPSRSAHPRSSRCRSWCAAPTSRSRSGRRCSGIPFGRLDQLPDDRACDRPAQGGARGRARGRRQQHLLADPLPPGDPVDRDHPQLPLGRAPKQILTAFEAAVAHPGSSGDDVEARASSSAFR